LPLCRGIFPFGRCLDAGLPKHLLQTLVIDHDTAAQVIQHEKIKGVTLTGSPRAGRSVAGTAGSALKKTLLELGGSDPYLILEDADLENAAKTCVFSRLNNSGQVCIAAKRIIVIKSIFERFEKLILKEIANYKTGDPMDPNIDLGPVLALISANDVEHAIRIANDSIYGLAAAIFTSNIQQGESIARDLIHAGTCYVNDFVASDPRLPFGGINASGHGRELSLEGIHEFTNIKTICIK
jgi:succinate-semialdehyde dehydrogenase/glutarate-semialdehyde dehydrogenase